MRLSPAYASSAVLAIASMLLLALLYRKSAECGRQAERLDTLYRQAKVLEVVAASSTQRADSISRRVAGLSLSPIHQLYINRLRELGLREPVPDLISDVRRHAEIIPYRGMHGGQMGFHDGDRIRVLSDSWVYAPFDDGDNSGEAILEYRVAPGGMISWRVLESRMR